MSDEEQINKKIKEAAENFRPAYNDNAWKKMEQLLDEHLPQKKYKRRIIFLLILLLIPAAAIYFGIYYENRDGTLHSKNTRPVIAPGTPAAGVSETPTSAPKTSFPLKGVIPADSASIVSSDSIHKISTGPVPYSMHATNSLGTKRSNISSKLFSDEKNANPPGKNEIISASKFSIVITEEPPVINASKEDAVPTVAVNAKRASDNPDIDSGKEMAEKNKAINKNDTTAENNARKMKRQVHQFTQNFSIGFVAGPDVSGVKLDNTGKLTFIIGAQIAYRIAHKFTLRSGFLAEKKIYSVGPGEYHSQVYNPANDYLKTVGANCTIYEVPLTLSYNFSKAKKHEWFVSGGLSSYFMKKESYQYFYKYPSGSTYTNYYSVSNKNKHYFSVVDLSAGYSHTINKRISFAVEPYLKLPLTGIGVGKIKLNSAGILFSLNLKTF